jgi:energy-coupling factor transporter ATP-binding protein EcfA2
MPTLTVPDAGFDSADDALDAFLTWVSDLGISLYPAQEEAVLELAADNHVLLKTPTGSGKSMVALALHYLMLAQGKGSVYTAPIKALVTEKFLALAETFGPDKVGLMTGDGAVNRDAPILCCTAEVLAKIALRHGEETPYDAVIMDEFHYYGDRDRGMAWQLPLLTMPHAKFLLMSATLGDTRDIEADLEARTGTPIVVVSSNERPVPLDFSYSMDAVDRKLSNLVGLGKSPVYAVHFTQRAAAELAGALLSTNLATKEQKTEIKAELKGMRFDSPYGPTLRRYLEHGVGLHHAGLLPKYRLLVEKLSQRGLFKVICGTDTLGVGINVPIRTVLFTQLCKFDGESVDILSVRDFKQIAGRAGRKGFDDQGFVVAQAPAWVIENKRLAAQLESGKKKKVVRKKPPTRGYKHWDEETFERLIRNAPEALESRFRVDHSLVLMVLQKAAETLDDPLEELHGLVDRSHESGRSKERLHTAVDARLDELVSAGVVVDHGEDSVPRFVVDGDLQPEFSMHHNLSLFLLHILSKLDPTQPDHAFDVVTMVESILEHPRVILRAQVNREKGELVARLKADGVPYEERMEALEDVTWPKPRAEWIYEVYNTYKEARPWLAEDPTRPKAIVREMVLTQSTFGNYVKGLGVQASEGVLLRYLSQVYKALLQNVPEEMHTPELIDVIAYLRAMLARVDDSLVSAWQSMKDDALPTDEHDAPIDISADLRSFRARIRAELYAVVRALSVEDYDEAAASIRQRTPFEATDFKRAIAPYLAERGPVPFDGRIRQGWTTIVEPDGPHRWTVRQVIVDQMDDADDDNTWSIDGFVDLSDDTNPTGPIVEITGISE